MDHTHRNIRLRIGNESTKADTVTLRGSEAEASCNHQDFNERAFKIPGLDVEIVYETSPSGA